MKKMYLPLFACCVLAFSLQAATITVTNLNDAGPGSLRQAVIDAVPGDVIDFSVTGTITLTTGRININKSLSINGPGMDLLSISGNNGPQLFQIFGSNVTVSLSGLTLEETTSASLNSGVRAISGAQMIIDACRITGHAGPSIVAQAGSSCTLSRSIICNNTNSIWIEGGTVDMENCIYAGNISPGSNTASFLIFGGSLGTIRNSTITGNDVGITMNTTSTQVSLYNNIIAGNLERDLDERNGTLMAENNLILNPFFNNVVDGLNGNKVGAAYDPLFVSPPPAPPTCLGDFQLQPASPAIDMGNNANAPTGPDLAGNPRIDNGTVDMGAFEYQTPPPPLVPTMGQWAFFLFALSVFTLGLVGLYNLKRIGEEKRS